MPQLNIAEKVEYTVISKITQNEEIPSWDHIMNPQKTPLTSPLRASHGAFFGIHWKEDLAKAYCIMILHNERESERRHNANSGATGVSVSCR